MESILLGITTGTSRFLFSQPFDRVRIEIQRSQRPLSMLAAASKVCHQGGLREFYKGGSPFFLGNLVLCGIHWKVYHESITRGGTSAGLAGALAGLAGSVVSTPTEFWRIQRINNHPPWRITSLFKGFTVTAFRDSIGYAAFFSTHAHLKAFLTDTNLTPYSMSVMVGTCSGIALWGSMYPIDIIKTRIQANDDPTILHAVRRLFKERGFYRGFSSTFLRAIPVNIAIVLSADTTTAFFHGRNTH